MRSGRLHTPLYPLRPAFEDEVIQVCKRLGERETPLVFVRVPRNTMRETSYGVFGRSEIARRITSQPLFVVGNQLLYASVEVVKDGTVSGEHRGQR